MVTQKVLATLLATGQSLTSPSPTISLPWNTYTATALPLTHSANAQIYKFQNVRFGDAPTGSMRFGLPSTPTGTPPPDPTGAIQCHQVDLLAQSIPYPGAPIMGDRRDTPTEDCLFLDIYVPKKVLDSNSHVADVPVVVWFYGGAYVMGAKSNTDSNNPLYIGHGLINAAHKLAGQEDIIFVAGNYRLGAFGWLAGSYMENHGTPNAGLYDQRLLLSWVQDYIGQVRGNKNAVTVWGQSAGAGSILHHLVLNGGSANLNFNRAILQSPGYQFQWDRKGKLNDTYTNVTALVPACKEGNITCLRNLPINDKALIAANHQYVHDIIKTTGQIPFGPAVDGSAIKRLPPNEFTAGHYNHGLESVLISHVNNEGDLFAPSWINDDAAVQKFLAEFFPGLPSIVDEITAQYPPHAPESPKERVGRIIGDSSFFCNTRQIFDAYSAIKTPTYNLWYDIGFHVMGYDFPAYHGTDVLPSFWTDEVDFESFLKSLLQKLRPAWPDFVRKQVATLVANFMKAFAPKFQKRLAAYSIYGNPNTNVNPDVQWPQATTRPGAELVDNVLHITQKSGYSRWNVASDPRTSKRVCDFWKEVAQQIDPPSPSLNDFIRASADVMDEEKRLELK